MQTRWPALLLSVIALTLSAQQPPANVDVPSGARPVLQARGEGVQIYTCTAATDGYKWVLKAPDANLLDNRGKVIGHHFAGPTWKLDDGGQVQGELIASKSSPDAASVGWLLLRAKPGTASGSLAKVAYIRRTDTHGGMAPTSGCESKAAAGREVRRPYTAVYTFYSEKQ